MTSRETAPTIDFDRFLVLYLETYRRKKVEMLAAARAAEPDAVSDADVELTEDEVAMILDELGDDAIAEAIEELLQDMPEAASMPPLQLSELLAEVLAETMAEEATS